MKESKKIIKRLALISLCIIMTLSIVACGTNQNSSSDGTQKRYKIGLSMNTLNNPYFVDAKNGVEKGASENNVRLSVVDAQNDPSKQITDVENLIAQKPDLIIIDPADSDSIVSAIEACNKNNIPVVTMDRRANGGTVVAHLGFDAVKSGNIAGEYIAKMLDGKDANIVEIQGIMGTNVAQDRSKGFNDVISKHKNIKKVATQSADFDRAKAMSVMENILQANKKIDAVYASNDEMALGALEAIKAAKRENEITLIGCDAIDDAISAVKNGSLDATIAEPPFFLGKNALLTAIKYLKGESVEKEVILESTLLTKDNVNTIKTKE